MKLSIIIPIDKADKKLDLCLLSALGQEQLSEMEVICIPLCPISEEDEQLLKAWQRRDDRITITESKEGIYESLKHGVIHARGDTLLFLRQTQVVSAGHLCKALSIMESYRLQVLLTAKMQLLDADAFAPCELVKAREGLLPKEQVYSARQAGKQIATAYLPLLYGNLYDRDYMKGLFDGTSDKGNAGDVVMAVSALIHAERISNVAFPIIRMSYEDDIACALKSEDIKKAEEAIAQQVMMTFFVKEYAQIARDVMMLYTSYILSCVHPFSQFCKIANSYKNVCHYYGSSMYDEITDKALIDCWKYLRRIANCDPMQTDNMIDIYTSPMRGLVLSAFTGGRV